MAYRRNLGARIRRARLRLGLTQPALARQAKISRIYVAKLEAGERQSPSLKALDRIAKALQVPLVNLLR